MENKQMQTLRQMAAPVYTEDFASSYLSADNKCKFKEYQPIFEKGTDILRGMSSNRGKLNANFWC